MGKKPKGRSATANRCRKMSRILPIVLLGACLLSPPRLLCSGLQKQGPPASDQAEQNPSSFRCRRGHAARAVLESAIFITASTLNYWRNYDEFKEDWQYDLTCHDQRRRFFSAESPKMDSNNFWLNWSHAFPGALYYLFGRSNGLSSRTSFLFSTGLSAFWECISEWREVISVNDMVFTSFGGPALGEPLFQISSHFSHRRGFFNQFAAFLFDPLLSLNNWLDRKEGYAANSAPAPAWHRFCLSVGGKAGSVSPAGNSYRLFNLGLDMETNDCYGVGTTRELGGFRSETISSRVYADFDFGSGGLEEFHIQTRAVLFGTVWQSGPDGGDKAESGRSGSLGFACAFDAFKKRPVAWYDGSRELPEGEAEISEGRFWRPVPTQFTDKLSVISPLGAVLDLSSFGRSLRVRWTAAAFGDFAAVNALAYNRYTALHDPSGVKSTLLNWGYYFALGLTLASDVSVDWRRWRLRGVLSCDWLESIQSQDRFQFMGVVTDDFRIRDSRLVWRLSLGYAIPRTPLELEVTADGFVRCGRILDITDRCRESRFSYRLNFLF
jgi:hypothetical protein